MTLGDLAALAAHGDQIAGHTVSHPDLTTLSSTDLATELLSSQQFLESNGYDPLLDFASPYGAYNEAVLAAVEPAYRSHRTVDAGYNSKDDWDIYRLKVQNMRSTTTQAEVDGWAARAAADKSWLINRLSRRRHRPERGHVQHDSRRARCTPHIVREPRAGDRDRAAGHRRDLAAGGLRRCERVHEAMVLGEDGYCDFTNNSSSCDDADACTVDDACSAGGCISGSTRDCGLYACNPASGYRTTCATGTECSAAAFCKPSSCASSCDDGNACTDDTADADRTCSSTPKSDGTTCGAQAECRSELLPHDLRHGRGLQRRSDLQRGAVRRELRRQQPVHDGYGRPHGLDVLIRPVTQASVSRCRGRVRTRLRHAPAPRRPARPINSGPRRSPAARPAMRATARRSARARTRPAPPTPHSTAVSYACDASTGCKTSCATGATAARRAIARPVRARARAMTATRARPTRRMRTAPARRRSRATGRRAVRVCNARAATAASPVEQPPTAAPVRSAPRAVPANCNDNNPCTTDTLSGDGLTCTHAATPNGTVCTGANRDVPARRMRRRQLCRGSAGGVRSTRPMPSCRRLQHGHRNLFESECGQR